MKTDFVKLAQALEPKLTAIRREIHAQPEVGNTEYKTAALIEGILKGLGLHTQRLTETAVMGTLRTGRPGLCAALRADMDALPLSEQTGAACASRVPGIMHACGHDVHVASALGAARILSGIIDKLGGEARFLFEPDEEGSGGAQRMTASGALEGADVIFGGHVDPGIAFGQIGVRYGRFYASSDKFDITLHGKSAHGAEPEKGIDALYAAALLTVKLRAIPEKLMPEKSVVTVGTFTAGNARNILAGEAFISGILRSLGEDSRKKLRDELIRACGEVEALTGARAEINIIEGYPGIVNNDCVTEYAQLTAEEVFGRQAVRRIDLPTLTTEDYGYFLEKLPGTFVHIGVGGEWPLHSPHFYPDDRACVCGAALYAALLDGAMNKRIKLT